MLDEEARHLRIVLEGRTGKLNDFLSNAVSRQRMTTQNVEIVFVAVAIEVDKRFIAKNSKLHSKVKKASRPAKDFLAQQPLGYET